MKKLLALLLALLLLLAMTACGSKDDPKEEDSTDQPSITTPDDTENGDAGDVGTDTPDQPATDDSTTNPPSTGDSGTTGGTTTNPPASGSGTTSKPNTGGTSTTKPSTGGSTTTKPSTGGSSTNGNTNNGSSGGSTSSDKGDLTTLMGKLLGDSTGEMSVMTEKIPADAYKSNLFIDYIEGAEAVSSTAMMSSVAHSVCLLKLPEGTDASKVKAQIDANKDPRKWVCVEAEKAAVLQSGNYIVLAMSQTDIVDTVSANFKSIFK